LASKGPAFRENIHRLFDEAQATDLAPGTVSLIESRGTHAQIREVPVGKILPNPAQPRLSYDEESLTELADSIREHGVLQPILVRPSGSKFELIAGERRWRASRMAERETIPAIVAEFDEQTALEISIIENLQREDVSPLEEAVMFRKMTDTFGYSVRQLAQKVGKDKGYIENRLRLTTAPEDVRELVSVRKDTISHAYELMKIGDERKRRRLAKRIVAGELSLAKLRIITGTTGQAEEDGEEESGHPGRKPRRRAKTAAGRAADARAADDALMGARSKLAEGIDDLVDILRQPELMEQIPEVNRANFAKHLTITKLKIENAIAIIRAGTPASAEGE
jgi:ParB family chromosome partitioning protein